MIVGRHINTTKQADVWEGIPVGFLVHVSKSNFNTRERALKNFKDQMEFKYNETSVQVTRF